MCASTATTIRSSCWSGSRGGGTVKVDGVPHPMVPGTTCFLGYDVKHQIINETDEDLVMVWVIAPAGLEQFFETIGRPREEGEPAPEPFARPVDTDEIDRPERHGRHRGGGLDAEGRYRRRGNPLRGGGERPAADAGAGARRQRVVLGQAGRGVQGRLPDDRSRPPGRRPEHPFADPLFGRPDGRRRAQADGRARYRPGPFRRAFHRRGDRPDHRPGPPRPAQDPRAERDLGGVGPLFPPLLRDAQGGAPGLRAGAVHRDHGAGPEPALLGGGERRGRFPRRRRRRWPTPRRSRS